MSWNGARNSLPVVPVAAEEPKNTFPVHHGDQPMTIVLNLMEPTVASRGFSRGADDLQPNASRNRRLDGARWKSN